MVRPSGAGQSHQTESPVTIHPALCRPHRHGGLRGDARERHVLLQVRTERLVAVEGPLTLPLGQLGQRRARDGFIWPESGKT